MNILKRDQNITKIQLTITLILILSFSVTGATYAYFAISATNNIITGDMATVNLTLDVTKIFPATNTPNTGVMVPQLSTSGSSTSPLAMALKSGCVDANQNVVCQVYKINIQNISGTATQVVDGAVSFYSNTAMTTSATTVMPNLKWKLIDSVNATTPTSSSLGSNIDLEANAEENIFADNIIMPTNSSFNYYMIIWLNEINEEQTDKSASVDNPNKYYGKIEFTSSNGTGVTSTFMP